MGALRAEFRHNPCGGVDAGESVRRILPGANLALLVHLEEAAGQEEEVLLVLASRAGPLKGGAERRVHLLPRPTGLDIRGSLHGLISFLGKGRGALGDEGLPTRCTSGPT